MTAQKDDELKVYRYGEAHAVMMLDGKISILDLRRQVAAPAVSRDELSRIIAEYVGDVGPEDWTQKNGRSGDSDEFVELSDLVDEIIRDSAQELLAGRSHQVGRLIVDRLARRGLAPRGVGSPPVHCHGGLRCTSWPDCESCGPARL